MFISLHKFQMHTKIDFILIFFSPLMSFVTYVCHFPIRINGHTSLFQTKFLMTYRIRPSLIYVVTSHTNVSYISPVDLLFGALRGEKRALFHLSLYLQLTVLCLHSIALSKISFRWILKDPFKFFQTAYIYTSMNYQNNIDFISVRFPIWTVRMCITTGMTEAHTIYQVYHFLFLVLHYLYVYNMFCSLSEL